MPGPISKLKHSVVASLLDQEDFILVVVNPACPGVHLPEELMQMDKPVGLHVGFRMTEPIPDLTLNPDGITATLSFNRTLFRCSLPWASIVQISAGDEHLIWLSPTSTLEPRSGPGKPAKEERPKLRLV
jgi:hypothetical protein